MIIKRVLTRYLIQLTDPEETWRTGSASAKTDECTLLCSVEKITDWQKKTKNERILFQNDTMTNYLVLKKEKQEI